MEYRRNTQLLRRTGSIEVAATGKRPAGRSRMLAGVCKIGADLHPRFVVNSSAIPLDGWRAREILRSSRQDFLLSSGAGKMVVTTELGRSMRSRRLQDALRDWGWTRVEAGRYHSPDGELDLLLDGESTIRNAPKKAWERWLRKTAPRVQDNPSQTKLQVSHPYFKGHMKLMSQSGLGKDTCKSLAAAGAARDYRWIAHEKGSDYIACTCERPQPDREHLAWNCPEREVIAGIRPPTCNAERKLMLTFVPLQSRQRTISHSLWCRD